MAKKKNTTLTIFMESVGLYFSNFDKFVKYMTFPVLGQIFGLCLTSYVFLQNGLCRNNTFLWRIQVFRIANYLLCETVCIILCDEQRLSLLRCLHGIHFEAR